MPNSWRGFLHKIMPTANADLATRYDLQTLEAKLGEKIETANANIIKWMAGLMIAQGAAIAALVIPDSRLLPGSVRR